MTTTVNSYTTLSFYNVPTVAKVIAIESNTVTVSGNFYGPASLSMRPHRNLICTNGIFSIASMVHPVEGETVIILSTPVHGHNRPSYVLLPDTPGTSVFPDKVTSLYELPEEVRILLSDGFATTEDALYDQLTSGIDTWPQQLSMTPDSNGVMEGGKPMDGNVDYSSRIRKS